MAVGEGVKVLRQLFKEIERGGGKKMFRESHYRRGIDADRTFDEALQMQQGLSMHNVGEPGGIYRANHPFEVHGLKSGSGTDAKESYRRYKRFNTQQREAYSGEKGFEKAYPYDSIALPLPGSRQKTFSVEEWEPYRKMPQRELTTKLKEDYDFVDFPDVVAGNPHMRQTVQLNPKKAVVRFNKTDYGIVGAGGVGAMGLLAGDALSPNDSEAAGLGLGKQIKGLFKLFKNGMRSKTPLGDEMRKAGQKGPVESRAHKALKGLKFKDGVVSGVYQGVGDSRYIHLEDGRIFPTNKDTLHDLCCAKGTTKYVDKFEKAEGDAVPGGGAKWDQILESLHMNETKGTPPRAGGSKPRRIEILEDSLNLRNDLLSPEEVADQIFVRSNRTKIWFMWPRVYAEPAEAAGLVTIDRTKKTLSTNKEFYNGSTKKVK